MTAFNFFHCIFNGLPTLQEEEVLSGEETETDNEQPTTPQRNAPPSPASTVDYAQSETDSEGQSDVTFTPPPPTRTLPHPMFNDMSFSSEEEVKEEDIEDSIDLMCTSEGESLNEDSDSTEWCDTDCEDCQCQDTYRLFLRCPNYLHFHTNHENDADGEQESEQEQEPPAAAARPRRPRRRRRIFVPDTLSDTETETEQQEPPAVRRRLHF